MKNIYKHVMLALLLVLGTANLFAQKRVSMGDGKNAAATLLVPDNANTKVINEHQALVSFGAEPKNVRHEGRVTHNFRINITDGDWQEIHVASGDDYLFDMMVWEGDGFDEMVEEGYYDIFIVGYQENAVCILTYDEFPVFQDIEFNASFNDCTFSLNIDGKDQNGNSLEDLEYVGNDYLINFEWRNHLKSAASTLIFYPYYFQEMPDIRFSGCDERSGVMVLANLQTADHVVYNITFPYQYGITGNVVLSNEFEKLTGHTERYYAGDSETSYFHNDYMTFFDENRLIGLLAWNGNITADACQPIMLYSDTRTDDPTDFSNGAITIDLPSFFENHHSMTYPYENKIAPFGFYHNSEGKLVREPFGKTRDDFNYSTPSYQDWLPITPTTVYSEPNEPLYFGERTPMIYNQPYIVKPEQSQSGNYGIQVHAFPIGENGCIRYGDLDASFVLLLDGEEAFNDTLINWPSWDELQVENPCWVDYEIQCNHLTVDGVEKSNFTFMECDLSSDDVTPPTMTFLQVKDADNRENVELTDLSQSTICFAAGDFSPHFNDEGAVDYMQYDGRPGLGVSYSYGNGDFTDLEVKEESSLFHENYGNVFTVDLAQIPADVNNTWVDVQFIFIDDAGNVQQQILSNLFYVGELTNVSESIATTSTVYPNPFQTSFTVNAVNPVSGKAVVNVYNVLGENVYTKAMNCSETNEFVIDGSSFNAGIYFYSIATENGTLQGRIVKE